MDPRGTTPGDPAGDLHGYPPLHPLQGTGKIPGILTGDTARAHTSALPNGLYPLGLPSGNPLQATSFIGFLQGPPPHDPPGDTSRAHSRRHPPGDPIQVNNSRGLPPEEPFQGTPCIGLPTGDPL